MATPIPRGQGDMLDAERYKLHFGPYRMPRCRLGERAVWAARGEVVVKGISNGRIPWPMTRHKRGRLLHVVRGGLAKAVRRESTQAVCYWRGVCPSSWRKALGVPANDEGTARLRKAWAPEI